MDQQPPRPTSYPISHQHLVAYRPRTKQYYLLLTSLKSISSKVHCTFLGPNLTFPPPGQTPTQKYLATNEKKNPTMANPPPPPKPPYLVPHNVTQNKIIIAHAPHLSLVHANANDAPVANLFCDVCTFSQNKLHSFPREKTGHMLARKKHGRSMRCASSIKACAVVQEQLASEPTLLHVSLSTGNDSVDLNGTIDSHDGNNANDRHNDGNTSNGNYYHPTSVGPPLPLCKPAHKKIEPMIVLDHTFMTFFCLSTFDNKPFQKGLAQRYIKDKISSFNNNFRKQLHFNFLATRIS